MQPMKVVPMPSSKSPHRRLHDKLRRGFLTIQTLMGHTDYALTANIYTHVQEETLRKGVALFSRLRCLFYVFYFFILVLSCSAPLPPLCPAIVTVPSASMSTSASLLVANDEKPTRRRSSLSEAPAGRLIFIAV